MYMVPWFGISVCSSVYVCVTFAVFTHCVSAMRPIYKTPESMEAGEYGLTPWTGFVTRREDVASVAELPWTHWCVWMRRDFVFIFLIFSLRRHTAFCKYRAFLTHLPLY